MFKQQVIFEVGGQSFGFDSMKVTTVEADVKVMSLSGAPECIVGFADLRGEIVPICDLYKKFRLRGSAPSVFQTVFVQTAEGNLGCIVDMVTEIGAVGEDIQEALPAIIRMNTTDYVAGIISHNGTLVTSIDADHILTQDEKARVKRAIGAVVEERNADAVKRAEMELAKVKAEEEKRNAAKAPKEEKAPKAPKSPKTPKAEDTAEDKPAKATRKRTVKEKATEE